MSPIPIPSLPRLAVAIAQLLVCALLLAGIWLALPSRVLWVDALGTSLAGLYLVSALALLAKLRWGRRLALWASWAGLGVGCATVSALALSIAQLAGQYGPVGSGGALLMGTVAALVLPYLVGLPLLQLSWLVECD